MNNKYHSLTKEVGLSGCLPKKRSTQTSFFGGLICEIIAECHLHSEFALSALV